MSLPVSVTGTVCLRWKEPWTLSLLVRFEDVGVQENICHGQLTEIPEEGFLVRM